MEDLKLKMFINTFEDDTLIDVLEYFKSHIKNTNSECIEENIINIFLECFKDYTIKDLIKIYSDNILRNLKECNLEDLHNICNSDKEESYSDEEGLLNCSLPDSDYSYYYEMLTNPGIKYYKECEHILVFDKNGCETTDFYLYNELKINDLNCVRLICDKKLDTIKILDFTGCTKNILDNNDNESLLRLFSNNTLISLHKINFGNLEINVDILLKIKNLKFDDKVLVRDTDFLDNKYCTATIPIVVLLNNSLKISLRKNKLLKLLLEPVETRYNVYYVDPYFLSERPYMHTAHLKLYIKNNIDN